VLCYNCYKCYIRKCYKCYIRVSLCCWISQNFTLSKAPKLEYLKKYCYTQKKEIITFKIMKSKTGARRTLLLIIKKHKINKQTITVTEYSQTDEMLALILCLLVQQLHCQITLYFVTAHALDFTVNNTNYLHRYYVGQPESSSRMDHTKWIQMMNIIQFWAFERYKLFQNGGNWTRALR
jgi:hypothetical protein